MGGPGATEGETEIAGMRMPAAATSVVALNEVLIHGWDLAVATGQEYRADPASAQACLEFGQGLAVGAPEMRDEMYGPVVPVPDDAPVFDRLLGQTGRDPGWTAPDLGGARGARPACTGRTVRPSRVRGDGRGRGRTRRSR